MWCCKFKELGWKIKLLSRASATLHSIELLIDGKILKHSGGKF